MEIKVDEKKRVVGEGFKVEVVEQEEQKEEDQKNKEDRSRRRMTNDFVYGYNTSWALMLLLTCIVGFVQV